jgi:hypothetical protein
MLVQILDAAAQPHLVAMQGQDQINDYSGSLGVPAVGNNPTLQEAAPANANRAGFLFQNTSANAMLLMELNETNPPEASSWVINPGQFFPPIPGYPIPTGLIMVAGTANSVAGDTYALRDWQTAAGE